MDISQGALAQMYLWAFFLGAVFGAVYDGLRITRVLFGMRYSRRAQAWLQRTCPESIRPHARRRGQRVLGVAVFLEDLLFCIAGGIALILLLYECNNGKFRFPVLPAAMAGFFIYRATLGRVVMPVFETAVCLLAYAVKKAIRAAVLPVRLAVRFCVARMQALFAGLSAKRHKRARRRYTDALKKEAAQNACGMVPRSVPIKATGRRVQVAKGKKTIQPDAAHARAARRSRRGVGGGVRQ